jgi:hypothetical protein
MAGLHYTHELPLDPAFGSPASLQRPWSLHYAHANSCFFKPSLCLASRGLPSVKEQRGLLILTTCSCSDASRMYKFWYIRPLGRTYSVGPAVPRTKRVPWSVRVRANWRRALHELLHSRIYGGCY